MLNRSVSRNLLMNTSRFFSVNLQKSPRIQFINIIPGPQYTFGLFNQAESRYPGTKFDPNVLQHNPIAEKIMLEQARQVAAGMEHILQLACKNRGIYEKENGEPHINGDTIVQVTTPEFFFYPALGLFSEELFENVILTSLQKTLKNMPSWLHFHFGTLPVQITNKVFNGTVINSEKSLFINAAIYGNGGEAPVVAFYSKKYPAKQSYSGVGMQPDAFDTETKSGDPYVHDFDTIDLQFPRCVYGETPSGKGFVKTLDICLDHANGVALEEYLTNMAHLVTGDIKGFYAVTSNTIVLEPGKVVFKVVSQTDPLSNVVYTDIQEKRRFFSTRLEFVGKQHSVVISTGADSTKWVPFDLEVHKTIEMSEMAKHTKKRISDNRDSLNNTGPKKL